MINVYIVTGFDVASSQPRGRERTGAGRRELDVLGGWPDEYLDERLAHWLGCRCAAAGHQGQERIARPRLPPRRDRAARGRLPACSDQNYLAHQLSRMQDAKAVVVISYAAGDAQVRADAPAYAALKAKFAKQGVEFLMLDSRLGETRAKVTPDAKVAGLDMPILFDYQQLVGEQLNITRAAEVIVVDPRAWTVAYRGPVDGAEKAIAGLTAGQKVAFAALPAKGGVIAFPEKARA